MKRALLWFVVTILAYAIFYWCDPTKTNPQAEKLYEASVNMMQIIGAVRQKRADYINPEVDPNRTGLIGEEFTELTTTVGELEAKRTTTNPDMAALVCFLLMKVGVKKDDCVAIGASGSFPGLIIATLSACKAVGAKTCVICSVGTSQWGANRLDFTVLDLFHWLTELGFDEPIIFCFGGSDNRGTEFSEEVRKMLKEKASRYGFQLYEGSSLSTDKEYFHHFYMQNCNGRIAAFLNIGGSLINVGKSSTAVQLYGIVKNTKDLDPDSMMGLMASENVPVLTFLNVRKLVTKYDLPWDPIPLPKISPRRYENLLRRFAGSD
ncbi:poly-gamma-glutamate system protein [Pseudothermotoga sp.]